MTAPETRKTLPGLPATRPVSAGPQVTVNDDGTVTIVMPSRAEAEALREDLLWVKRDENEPARVLWAALDEALTPVDIRPASYTGPLGRDAEGYLVKRHDGIDFRVTGCCGKDATTEEAKDGEWIVVCRRCKQPIDEEIGGRPVAPYTEDDGTVTATEVLPRPK